MTFTEFHVKRHENFENSHVLASDIGLWNLLWIFFSGVCMVLEAMEEKVVN